MDDLKNNILVAYPYMKADVIDRLSRYRSSIRFVLDSGAFTAWRAKKPVKLDDYCRFIESLPVEPWRYFALDVIGDPKRTMENYQTMVRRGFNPIPIFTRGEDPSVLDDYYATSDVVGIGGLVGTLGNKGFVKGIMRSVGQRKVHWLGFTDIKFISFFRPYMCDASSWAYVSKFAYVFVYLGLGRHDYMYKREIRKLINEAKVRQSICALGINPDDLLDDKNWRGANCASLRLSVAGTIRRNLDVEQKFGTKVFSACASSQDLDVFIDQFSRIKGR